jgi:hypothetical protein
VTIPEDPPQPSPGPAPASGAGVPSAADTVTSFASLKVPKRQDVDRLVVRAGMAEEGAITASGTVSVPNLAKVYRLKAVSATAAPEAVVKLRLRLPRKGLHAAKKALRRHEHVEARIRVTARDAAGNVAISKRTVRLTN